MNFSINKLIIAAGVILVILIAVTLFISNIARRNQPDNQQSILVPTSTLSDTGRSLSQQEIKKLEQEVEEINNNVLSSSQSAALDEIKAKLPASNDDFAIGYSDSLGQFFIQKKSDQADDELQNFLRANNFSDVFQQFPDLFVYTDSKPIDQTIQQAEQNLADIKEEFYQQQIISLTPKPKAKSAKQEQIERDRRMLKSFSDFAGSLFTFSTGGSSSLSDLIESALTPTQAPTGTGESDGTFNNGSFTDRQISQTLMGIFMEAGNRVNIAPKFLAAIMRMECAELLYASENEIPKNLTLPPSHDCFKTGEDVYGPMQFKDWVWAASYASKVADLTGHHPADIENIRDAVFGAALKLKAAAQAKDPFNLTRLEVFRAASTYNVGHQPSGECDNPPYCQAVWTYYTNH